MKTLSRGGPVLFALLAILLSVEGCNNSTSVTQSPGPVDGGGMPSKTKQIMTKLGKGPQALDTVIGTELKAEQPAWDTIQPQTKEYADLAAALATNEPTKGSRESWAKLTTEFSASSVELHSAAEAKDLDKAKAAQVKLKDLCKKCHDEFRGRGPGPGR